MDEDGSKPYQQLDKAVESRALSVLQSKNTLILDVNNTGPII